MVARTLEDGTLTYDVQDIRGTVSPPTISLDDFEYEALHSAMESLPARFHGASHLDHLADTKKQRDNLMALTERLADNHHQLAMQALGST